MKSANLFWRRAKLPLAVSLASTLASPAFAVSFNIGEIEGQFDSSLSIGASWSTANPNKNLIGVNNGGKGMAFPLEQETEVAGKVDLNQLTLDSADGLDENAQREKVATIAKVYNELLPEIPLFERYGNNMISEERVQPWPADDDPIYQNSPYADGIVTILMLTGKLQPK